MNSTETIISIERTRGALLLLFVVMAVVVAAGLSLTYNPRLTQNNPSPVTTQAPPPPRG